MITNPRLSTFYVVGQRQAADFLTGHLGFRTITDVPYGDGRRWIEVRPPAAQTSVALAAVSPRLHTELAETAAE